MKSAPGDWQASTRLSLCWSRMRSLSSNWNEKSRYAEQWGLNSSAFPFPIAACQPARSLRGSWFGILGKMLTEGGQVAVHCRQGIGRAGLIASSLLVSAGLDAPQALERLSFARGCRVPEDG